MKLPRTCFVSPFLPSFINYLLSYTRKVFSVPLILSPSDWLTGVAPDFHESSSVIHTRTVVVEKYVTQPAQTRVLLLPASLHRALDYVVVLSYQRHLRPPAIGTTTSTYSTTYSTRQIYPVTSYNELQVALPAGMVTMRP